MSYLVGQIETDTEAATLSPASLAMIKAKEEADKAKLTKAIPDIVLLAGFIIGVVLLTKK